MFVVFFLYSCSKRCVFSYLKTDPSFVDFWSDWEIACSHFFFLFLFNNKSTIDLYDNFGSHTPYFIILISLLQLGCFICWIIFKDSEFGLYKPISGPSWSWLRIMSDYPSCNSLKSDWWRYLTYQFVHSGLMHLVFNLFMQLLFGLPLNMVHGSFRFGLIYELGVMLGALTFVTVSGTPHNIHTRTLFILFILFFYLLCL